MYGAVRNQSLQYWEHQDVRNRYRDAILSHPDKDDTPDDPQEPDRIQGTGSSGKPDTRKASRTSSPHIPDASFLEGKKYAEIASNLSLSVKTVEAEMTKALRTLRDELEIYMKYD